MTTWPDELIARVVPAAGQVGLGRTSIVVAVIVALIAVGVPALWRWLRLAVTLVHELGHAMVGILVGRRFAGFVLNGDMSGHAVTVGRPRGFGRVASTWAGYPMPGIVGAMMVWLAVRGWAAPFLTALLLVLLFSLIRIRSGLTAVVMIAALASTGSLWWWRDNAVQAQALVATGIVLVIGAWRHLGAVASSRDSASDPGVLARLTGVPRVLWNLSFALVLAGASWVVGAAVLAGFA